MRKHSRRGGSRRRSPWHRRTARAFWRFVKGDARRPIKFDDVTIGRKIASQRFNKPWTFIPNRTWSDWAKSIYAPPHEEFANTWRSHRQRTIEEIIDKEQFLKDAWYQCDQSVRKLQEFVNAWNDAFSTRALDAFPYGDWTNQLQYVVMSLFNTMLVAKMWMHNSNVLEDVRTRNRGNIECITAALLQTRDYLLLLDRMCPEDRRAEIKVSAHEFNQRMLNAIATQQPIETGDTGLHFMQIHNSAKTPA